MSNYVMNLTDPLSPSFTIAPGAYNGPGGPVSSTTLRLYGQGAREWGESVNEDLLKLLENFMSASAPVYPINGQMWVETFLYYHDTTANAFYVYDFTRALWTTITVTSATTQPAGYVGQYWFNTTTSELWMYFSAYKQQVAGWHKRSMMSGAGVPNTLKPRMQVRIYDASSTAWVMTPVVNITSDTTAPANGQPGSLRYDTATNLLYVWDGAAWDALSPAGSAVFSGTINANSFKVINVADATNPTDAMNQRASDARYLQLSGGTLTGPLVLSGAPTLSTHAATKAYVDSAVTGSSSSVPTIPIGGIIMWSNLAGAIPSNWHLCDGTSGTPDLRDKFIVCAGVTHTAGQTGGSADIPVVSHTHTYSSTTLSSGAHSHTGSTDTIADHTHSYQHSNVSVTSYASGAVNASTGGALVSDVTGPAGSHSHQTTTNVAGVHTHQFSGTTDSTGSSGSGANLPPYYALAFIMRIS